MRMGNNSSTRSTWPLAFVPVDDEADLQIFPNRQVRKNIAALRDIADAKAGALVGFEADEFVARKFHGAGVGFHEADNGFERGWFLPTPLRPIRQTRLCSGTVQIHAAQNARAIVADGDVGEA